MAMTNCFQVGPVCTAGVGAVAKPSHLFASSDKLNLPTSQALTGTVALSSPIGCSLRAKGRRPVTVCKAKEALDEVQVVTDSSWDKLVIGSDNPVLVEFWAPWCGPCRMIAPVIDELAKEYSGKISCFKVNTDDCPSIATNYGIRSIPTVLFFKKGERKESIIGAVPKSTLSNTIEKYIES